MNNKLFFSLFFSLFFFVQVLFGQLIRSKDEIRTLNNFLKLKVGLESGIEWEQKINVNSVISIGFGLNIARQTDNLYQKKAPLIFIPDSYAEYRNYFNFSKRLKSEKKIRNNSADFFFGKIETFYAVKNQNYFGLLFIEGFGGQRSITRRLSFDTHFDVIEHIYFDKPPYGEFNYIKIEPDLEFSIFYIIE